MKKHNILKVVLITLLAVVLCTWIFPTASFSYTELTEGARSQLGLFDLFSYPLVALSYFGYAFFYVLLVGGLFGILNKIPAYKALLEKIVKGFKGREWLFLSITMVLLSVLTSVVGMSFGFIVLFPLIISIVLMMGYNKLVAASVTVGSVVVGLIGTTLGEGSINYINAVLGTTVFDEIITKIAILVVALILLIFNVLNYAKKTKNNSNKENEDLIPEKVKVEKGKKVRIWPMAVVIDVMLLLMLLGTFPWNSVFELTIFEDALTWLQELEIFGFPIFVKVFGNVNAFGNWSFNVEMPFLIIISSVILALVYRVKFDDILEGISNGFKKAVKPATLTVLIFMILVVATYHPFQLVFVKALLGLTKGINVVTMTVIAFLASLFNVDPIYVAQSTLPYVISVLTDSSLYPLIGIIFQTIYGLAMLVLPSSVILMITLSYMDISYGQWLKHIWKLFLELLVVLVVIFIILLII